MSILKIAAVSEAPRDRILAIFMYQLAPSKTDNGVLTGGYACSPKRAFEEMLLVQKSHRKTEGRQLIPFIVSITPDNPEISNEIYLKVGDEIARIHQDFQCCFALHLDSKTRHLHFLMNAVSYRDGHKYSQSKADFGVFRQKINDILYRYKFDVIIQKLHHQPDMTNDVKHSDFSFWETEQAVSSPPSSGYQLQSGPPIRDFFNANTQDRQYSFDRDPDAPNPYARNEFFEDERRSFMINANNEFGNLHPKKYHAAVGCQMTKALIPTVTFNLDSTFKGTAEQLAEAQAQIEQQQLNRTGTFALEFQRMAQLNGIAVNMEFNIHNAYNLSSGSAEGNFGRNLPNDPNAMIDANYSEE